MLELERVVARIVRKSHTIAVIFVDIDRFQLLNQSFGPLAGDEALRMIAERARGSAGPRHTVARVGGDQFVVIAESLADSATALAIGRRMLESIAAPVRIAGRDLILTASIGIALAVDGDDSAPGLIRDGAAAMHRAKQQGGNRVELFELEKPARA